MVQAALAGDQKSDARTMFLRICQSESIPLLLKEDFQLLQPTADAPWQKTYQEALAANAHGAWLSAAEKLEGLVEQAPDEPAIQQNLAVLYSWLGREQEAPASCFRIWGQRATLPKSGSEPRDVQRRGKPFTATWVHAAASGLFAP